MDSSGAVTSANYTDTLGRVIQVPTAAPSTTDYTGCTGTRPISSAKVWTVPGPAGTSRTFKLCYVSIAIQTNFGTGVNEVSGTGTFLQSVVLPNGTTWTFEYDSRAPSDPTTVNYADLTKITFPTGGFISYTYVNVRNPWCSLACTVPVSRYVATRTVNANDGTGPHTWNYTWVYSPNPWTQVTATATDPQGNDAVHVMAYSTVGFHETQRQIFQGSSAAATLLKTVITDWPTVNPNSSLAGWFAIRETTTWANGKTTKIERDYNTTYGQVLAKREYDYGSGAPGPLIRQTTETYLPLSNATYLANNLLDLISTQTVADGLSAQIAQTTYAYDESALISSGIATQHDSNPPTGTARGNQTSVRRWLNSSTVSTTNCPVSVGNGYLVNTRAYNDTGTVAQSVDACGHTTTFSYSSTFAGAYLTQTRLPDTTSPNLAQHVVGANYDFSTGMLTSSTDQNSQTTAYAYDNMLRPTTITNPDGGQTNFYYPDPNTVEIQSKIDAARWTDQFVRVDGLGREIRRISANDELTPWDQVDTCYDARGKVSFKSYAYQGSGLPAPKVCSGLGDAFSYDALGRATTVTHSDGSTILASYNGAATSVSDEGNGAQRIQRISQVDGLGRVISVCEVTSTTLIGTSGTPAACGQDIAATGFLTTYGYDTLNNLTSVTQGALNPRSFQYNSLSQLMSAANPESGTITYAYDADGALITKTAPKPNQTSPSITVSTTMSYDALHRLRSKTYSDGTTPSVTFNYDESASLGLSGLLNTLGRQSSSTVANSQAGEVFSYDQLGRVKTNSQCTPQNCALSMVFPISYTYDLLGDATTGTNGVGVTLTHSVNRAGRLTALTSSLSDVDHPGTLLSAAHFNAAGLLLSASLGNALNEARSYDGRLRLTSITNGTVYALTIPANGYAPNGDILAANDSVNGNWTYSYDAVNRLIAANKSGTEIYNYDYDRFGNRWHQNGPRTMMLSFSSNNSKADGYSYDSAGNLLSDGLHSYTYDAENRIVQVDGGSTAAYVYDANGRRVRKTTASGSVDFLYDIAGREVAEVASSGSWNRGEIYAGASHLATYKNSTTYFIHSDWLGTERVRSDKSGASYATCTSLPFGDWLACSGPSDPSPLHFTGKEHDLETGLDDFGARYYTASLGRWMTPDWSARQDPIPYADLRNPQSLNLYAYVGNNPVTRLDPDGHAQSADQVKQNQQPPPPPPKPRTPPPPPPPAQPQKPQSPPSAAQQMANIHAFNTGKNFDLKYAAGLGLLDAADQASNAVVNSVQVGGSVSAGPVNVSTDGDVSVNAPAEKGVGASLDVKIGAPSAEDTAAQVSGRVLGPVSLGTNITNEGDIQGINVSVGTPGPPVQVSTPLGTVGGIVSGVKTFFADYARTLSDVSRICPSCVLGPK